MNLEQTYKAAARAALADDVDAADESHLVQWTRANCRFRPENEFFLVLGIGCELADLQSRVRGYGGNVHEAIEKAKAKSRNPEGRNAPWD